MSLKLYHGNELQWPHQQLIAEAPWEDPACQPHVVMYDDNYFDLFPKEKKRVSVDFRTPEASTGPVKGTLIIAGTNVPEIHIPVSLIEGQ